MTVRELMVLLQNMPQDLPVWVCYVRPETEDYYEEEVWRDPVVTLVEEESSGGIGGPGSTVDQWVTL